MRAVSLARGVVGSRAGAGGGHGAPDVVPIGRGKGVLGAVQGPPQQKVRAMDSATQAVWESEHWLVSPPVGPRWVEVPRRVAATED
jgi:hypothetical protein